MEENHKEQRFYTALNNVLLRTFPSQYKTEKDELPDFPKHFADLLLLKQYFKKKALKVLEMI